MKVTFTSVVFQDGKFWIAKCVELGVVSQGFSETEALQNLREAVALYLEDEPEVTFPTNHRISNFEVEYA